MRTQVENECSWKTWRRNGKEPTCQNTGHLNNQPVLIVNSKVTTFEASIIGDFATAIPDFLDFFAVLHFLLRHSPSFKLNVSTRFHMNVPVIFFVSSPSECWSWSSDVLCLLFAHFMTESRILFCKLSCYLMPTKKDILKIILQATNEIKKFTCS